MKKQNFVNHLPAEQGASRAKNFSTKNHHTFLIWIQIRPMHWSVLVQHLSAPENHGIKLISTSQWGRPVCSEWRFKKLNHEPSGLQIGVGCSSFIIIDNFIHRLAHWIQSISNYICSSFAAACWNGCRICRKQESPGLHWHSFQLKPK